MADTKIDASSVVVVLSGSEEAITFPGATAVEEHRTLLVYRHNKGVVARFELGGVKHWWTDQS